MTGISTLIIIIYLSDIRRNVININKVEILVPGLPGLSGLFARPAAAPGPGTRAVHTEADPGNLVRDPLSLHFLSEISISSIIIDFGIGKW